MTVDSINANQALRWLNEALWCELRGSDACFISEAVAVARHWAYITHRRAGRGRSLTVMQAVEAAAQQ